MTTETTLAEATLIAPAFCGSDEEVAGCTSSWASIVSSITYLNNPYVCGSNAPMSAENKKAIFGALQAFLASKLAEINNITPPPEVATTAPFVPPVAVPEVPAAGQEIEIAYESKKPIAEKIENSMLKRMRELAGIPHSGNHV